MNIRVGDKVEATPKDSEDVKLVGKVQRVVELKDGTIVSLGSLSFHTKLWDVKVLERAFQLPTEPGLYTVAQKDAEIVSRRLFMLDRDARWSEYKDISRPHDKGADAERLLRLHRWTLRKLTIAEGQE